VTDLSADADAISGSTENPARFTAIFDRHVVAVHNYVARRVGDVLADELTGEVFCIAFERRATFDLTCDDARPWLFGIASRLVQRSWRTGDRSARAYERLRHERQRLSVADVSDRIEGGEFAVAVAAALDRLPEAERETLLLFAWDRFSYAQIGEMLGIPVGTVRSRIARARDRLRDHLAAAGHPVPEPTTLLPKDTPS
jgi:RNA polymerase sigma factor (sigma-70 family)